MRSIFLSFLIPLALLGASCVDPVSGEESFPFDDRQDLASHGPLRTRLVFRTLEDRLLLELVKVDFPVISLPQGGTLQGFRARLGVQAGSSETLDKPAALESGVLGVTGELELVLDADLHTESGEVRPLPSARLGSLSWTLESEDFETPCVRFTLSAAAAVWLGEAWPGGAQAEVQRALELNWDVCGLN